MKKYQIEIDDDMESLEKLLLSKKFSKTTYITPSGLIEYEYEYKFRYCPDCGANITNRPKSAKRCKECARKRKLENDRQSMRKKRLFDKKLELLCLEYDAKIEHIWNEGY